MAVTAKLIQELRKRTGIGMNKCKEALVAAGGDIEKAIADLRKAGMASAVKKAGRETTEGMIVAAETGDAIALMEVNAETDFVVKNEAFQQFAQEMAQEAADTKPASLEAFLAQPSKKNPSETIDQLRAVTIQSLGENIQIGRLEIIQKPANSAAGVYSHMGGKIVCIVEIEGSDKEADFAREIAMHAVAEAPDFLKPEDVPADVKAHEEDIARSQVKDKPADIQDKIIAGKLQAFYKQACLLNQPYVKDPASTVAQLVEKQGSGLKLSRFWRWQIGA